MDINITVSPSIRGAQSAVVERLTASRLDGDKPIKPRREEGRSEQDEGRQGLDSEDGEDHYRHA